MKPITIGVSGTAETIVTEQNTAKAVGSGTLSVFATPMMTALMEQAACAAVSAFLEAEETTVGTSLEIRHLAATPPGMRVTASAEVTNICGRELMFHVTASDASGVIGEGTHKRFLVQTPRFLAKAESRKESQT